MTACPRAGDRAERHSEQHLHVTQEMFRWCPPPGQWHPLGACTHTVGAAPLALGGLLQLGVQADEVVGTGTGVAQDDLPSLLAHLTVVLVVCLVSVPFFNYKQGTHVQSAGQNGPLSQEGMGQLLLYVS